MRIEEDIKLDYNDVLIRPKRSTMASRKEVNIERTYTFFHSRNEWTGIPIMSANMDTVGTPDMHKALIKHNTPIKIRNDWIRCSKWLYN